MEPKLEEAMLEIRISHALEQPPQVAIPANFAARVAANAGALSPRKPVRQARYGLVVALAAACLLLVALFALAPFAGPGINSAAFLAEMVVLVQLGGLAYWFGRARRELF